MIQRQLLANIDVTKIVKNRKDETYFTRIDFISFPNKLEI